MMQRIWAVGDIDRVGDTDRAAETTLVIDGLQLRCTDDGLETAAGRGGKHKLPAQGACAQDVCP